jgi:SAM-dependent methyltransferase
LPNGVSRPARARREGARENLTRDSDVFGRALWEWAHGSPTPETLERDDGFTQEGAGPEVYLSDVGGWPSAERQALRFVRGRVLDVGCGAGRTALELQRRGVDVVGLDASPLAAAAARVRGVNEVWVERLDDLRGRLTDFDSLVLFGNNFGLFETPPRARRALRRLARVTSPRARILVESTSPYFGGAPALDRTYYRRNKARGGPPGQVRLRYHFEDLTGPWFHWIYVSPREMRDVLRDTGWHQERVIGSTRSEPYVAILAKD